MSTEQDWPERERAMEYMRAMVKRWGPEYPCRDTCYNRICLFAPVCRQSTEAVAQFEVAYDDWLAAGGQPATMATLDASHFFRRLTDEEKVERSKSTLVQWPPTTTTPTSTETPN